MNNIRINKSLHFGAVITGSHIDKTVFICYYAISAVVTKDYETITCMLCYSTVGIIIIYKIYNIFTYLSIYTETNGYKKWGKLIIY